MKTIFNKTKLMKKSITLIICLLAISISVLSQKSNNQSDKDSISTAVLSQVRSNSYYFISANTGINNFTGIGGLSTGVYYKDFKLHVGAGKGLGNKYSIGTGYKFLWVNYTYASGLNNVEFNTKVASGATEKVKFDFKPASMLDITFDKVWLWSSFRLNFEVGYSILVSGGEWSNPNNTITIDSNTKKAMDLMKPGGLYLGLGLGFKIFDFN